PKQKPVLAYKYHGTLIRAYEAIAKGAFDHGFGTKTFVQDERFITPAHPVAFVRYATTNRTIPETYDPRMMMAAMAIRQTQPSSAFGKVQWWVRHRIRHWRWLWRKKSGTTLPNPLSRANGRQPSALETNATPAAVAP